MESKLKISIFNSLRSKKLAQIDVALLQKHHPYHTDLSRYLRNPERYSDEILWALLGVCDADTIVSNRKNHTADDGTKHDGSNNIDDTDTGEPGDDESEGTETEHTDPTDTLQQDGDSKTSETNDATSENHDVNPDGVGQTAGQIVQVPSDEESASQKTTEVEPSPDSNDSKIPEPDDPSKKK